MVGGSALYRTYPRLESIIVDVASFWSVTRGFSQQLPFSPRPIQGSLRLGKGTHTTLDPTTFAGIIYLLFPSLKDFSWDGMEFRDLKALKGQLAAYREADWRALTPSIFTQLGTLLSIDSVVDGEEKTQARILGLLKAVNVTEQEAVRHGDV